MINEAQRSYILLTPQESDLILGRIYQTAAMKVLDWSFEEWSERYGKWLQEPHSVEGSLLNFFGYIAEMTELTLTLYKWGILLYGAENGLWADIALRLELDGKQVWPLLKNETVVVLWDGKKVLFETSTPLCIQEMMLYLGRYTSLHAGIADLPEMTPFPPLLRLSFDRDSPPDEMAMDYLREEFAQKKARLDKLREIFEVNFPAEGNR